MRLKKKLLHLSVLFVIVLNFHAQTPTVYVAPSSEITVNGTLFYVKGGVELGSSSPNVGNVFAKNKARIIFEGTATDVLESGTGPGYLFLDGTSPSDYSQLYTTGYLTANMKLKVLKSYHAPSHGGFQQMAIPLDDTIMNHGISITGNSTTFDYTSNRYRANSLYFWDNGRARSPKVVGNTFRSNEPTRYYMIPTGAHWDPINGTVTYLSGSATYTSDVDGRVSVDLGKIFSGNFGAQGGNRNGYAEKYNSYIDDPFADRSLNWDTVGYGKNLYQFGNPFLTNIDLRHIGYTEPAAQGDDIAIPDIVGVAYYDAGNINYTVSGGTSVNTANMKVVTANNFGVLVTGDVEDALIKPMGVFMIKRDGTKPALPLGTMVDFSKTRTFSATTRQGSSPAKPLSASLSMGDSPETRLLSKASLSMGEDTFRQVAAILKDASGNEIGRTYYAVSNQAKTGSPKAGSRDMQSYKDVSPIFTKEESLLGGEDVTRNEKLYINVANATDFMGKEMPLVVEASNAKSLSFELYEQGVKLENNAHLTNGKSFYIKTKKGFTKIASGTSVPVEAAQYGLYYEKPSGLIEEEVVGNTGTRVAKLGYSKDYAVVFDKSWKTADIEVFSATGQLVHVMKKVPTTSNYILPISLSNALYVVKVVSDKGEVVTQKIIK